MMNLYHLLLKVACFPVWRTIRVHNVLQKVALINGFNVALMIMAVSFLLYNIKYQTANWSMMNCTAMMEMKSCWMRKLSKSSAFPESLFLKFPSVLPISSIPGIHSFESPGVETLYVNSCTNFSWN